MVFHFHFLIAQSTYVCSKSISIQLIVHNTHVINKALLAGVVYPSYHTVDAFKNRVTEMFYSESH